MGQVYEGFDGERGPRAAAEVRRLARRDAVEWGGGVAMASDVQRPAVEEDTTAMAQAAMQQSMDLRNQDHTFVV